MAYQPVNSLSELSKFSNVPLALTGDALASIDRGQQADQSNLQDLFSQNQHMQTMRPMQEQQLDLGNQTARATLPGIVAQSDITGRKNKMEASTFDFDVKNKLSEAALKASENDLKGIEQHAQQLMYSLNPQEALEGQRLFEASKHMREVRFKADTEKAVAKIRGDTAMATTGMRIGSNERINGARLGNAATLKQWELTNKRLLDKPTTEALAGRYRSWAVEARSEGNSEEATKYEAEAARLMQESAALRQAGVGAGNEAKVDVNALTNGAVPTVAPRAPVATQPPAKAGTKENPIKLD
jgi:hypothetical protein